MLLLGRYHFNHLLLPPDRIFFFLLLLLDLILLPFDCVVINSLENLFLLCPLHCDDGV